MGREERPNTVMQPTRGTLATVRCIECGRAPRAGELWRLYFADLGEVAIFARSARSESSARPSVSGLLSSRSRRVIFGFAMLKLGGSLAASALVLALAPAAARPAAA